MQRCLIVANQTLATDKLAEAVQERMSAEQHEFHVVAPATPVQNEAAASGAHATAPSTEEIAYGLARQRLDRALDQLRALGAVVDGEVGDPDPVQAVRDTLGHFAADEIVISTLPRGLSQWLHRDVPARLRKASDVPVTQLTAES